MWTTEMILVSLNTLALAGLGTAYWLFAKKYAGAYMQKKAENLATHEDIEKLRESCYGNDEEDRSGNIGERLEQAKALADEARGAVRGGQKNVGTRRGAAQFVDCYERRPKERGGMEDERPSDEEKLAWFQTRSEGVMRWSKASREFDESKLFVTVVCGRDSIKAFLELGVFVSRLASEITKDAASYEREKVEVYKKLMEAKTAIRKELEVDI